MLEFTNTTVIPFFIVAFSGTVLTFNISQEMESSKMKHLFYYLGQNTLVIFALHMLCFKIGNLLKILIYNYPMNRLAEFHIIFVVIADTSNILCGLVQSIDTDGEVLLVEVNETGIVHR